VKAGSLTAQPEPSGHLWPSGHPGVAPFLSVRVSAVAPGDLLLTEMPATVRELAAARAGDDQAAAVTQPLVEELHALVPQLDSDREQRRAVLRIKRDVHNGRLTPRLRADAAALTVPSAAGRLRTWIDAVGRREEHLIRGEHVVRTELDKLWPAMREALTRPDVLAGLSMASPLFAAEISGRGGAQPGVGSRLARTTISYLARASVKTSPFSSLTCLALADIGPSRPGTPARVARGAEIIPSRALATALLCACAADPEASGAIPCARSESLFRDGGDWVASLVRHRCLRGQFGISEHADVVAGHSAFLDLATQEWRRSLPDWAALVDGPDGWSYVRRLLALGILQPVAPWEPFDRHPLRALHRRLSEVPGDRIRRIAALVEELDAAHHQLAAADAPTRVRMDSQSRRLAHETFAALEAAPPAWLDTAPLWYENVAADMPEVALPDAVADDLAAVGAAAARQMRTSPLYRWLVELFVARYGPGGRTGNFFEFLINAERARSAEALEGPGGSLLLQRLSRTEPAAQLHGHHTLSPPTLAVSFQLAAETMDSVARGEYLMVINRVNRSGLGLVARWGTLPGVGERTRLRLRHWIGELHPGCETYQFAVGGDWSSIQLLIPDLLPNARWPAELPSATGGGLDLRSVRLSHDPATATLQAADSSGAPVAFVNVGVMPDHLVDGPEELLLALSHPWYTALVANGEDHFLGPRSRPAGVEFRPRRQHGRVVYERATWRMEPAAAPRREPSESWARYLYRLERWRKDLGLPPRVFLRWERAAPQAAPGKPAWLSFASPHAISAAFAQAPPDATALELVEALPDLESNWYLDHVGRSRTTEFMGLVRCDS
jgi:hypothetical protein